MTYYHVSYLDAYMCYEPLHDLVRICTYDHAHILD